MVKGIQRDMVIVRTAESENFEMAYFILRADSQRKSGEKSIIDEANSIVSAVCADGARDKSERQRFRRSRVFFFLSGTLCGALALGTIYTVVSFL